MKPLASLIWQQVLLLLLAVGCAAPTPRVSASDQTSWRIRHNRTRDLRTLFLPESEVDRLEREHLCRIEYYRDRAEIQTGAGISLNKLILKYMQKDYDGQIKVVSRDSIVQTPFRTYAPSDQERIIVMPGDLVFIQGRS